MKDTHLAAALRTLTKFELRQLGNFIKSPYFNNRSEVVRFYEAIKVFYPGFDINDDVKEKLFRKVYPGKKVSDVLMRKLFSLTTNLLTEFLTISSFRENKLEYGIKMIDKLREKNCLRFLKKNQNN